MQLFYNVLLDWDFLAKAVRYIYIIQLPVCHSLNKAAELLFNHPSHSPPPLCFTSLVYACTHTLKFIPDNYQM